MALCGNFVRTKIVVKHIFLFPFHTNKGKERIVNRRHPEQPTHPQMCQALAFVEFSVSWPARKYKQRDH